MLVFILYSLVLFASIFCIVKKNLFFSVSFSWSCLHFLGQYTVYIKLNASNYVLCSFTRNKWLWFVLIISSKHWATSLLHSTEIINFLTYILLLLSHFTDPVNEFSIIINNNNLGQGWMKLNFGCSSRSCDII